MTVLGNREYDNLFAGSAEVVTDSVVVGGSYGRGTVLGIVTESNEAVAVDSTSADGSETPYAILADDTNDGDSAVIYLTGEFNQNALIFGGDDSAEDHKTKLREIGIFLKENQEA